LKYKYYAYRDANPGPQPYAWGAFDYCVVNKVSKVCEPLDLKKVYSVGTNEFLAPAGGIRHPAYLPASVVDPFAQRRTGADHILLCPLL
jgi:hypothetical protein